MTLADMTLAYDFLRQKERLYAQAVERHFIALEDTFDDDGRAAALPSRRALQWTKDEVDRAFALFIQDLTSYIRES